MVRSLVPADLLFATGLAQRETIDYLRKIYNKEFLSDIKKDKLSEAVAQLVEALDDAPSPAKFLRIVDDPGSFFIRAHAEAFRAYLDEKNIGVHWDFFKLVLGTLRKQSSCAQFMPLFATWYNQCLLQKKAAKVLSNALQKGTVKGLKEMYQKYVDEETGLLKPVTIEVTKEPAPEDIVEAVDEVAASIFKLVQRDTYNRFAGLGDEARERLGIGVLPYPRNKPNQLYYTRRIATKNNGYETDIKKSGYDAMWKFATSEFSTENVECFNAALDVLQLRADYKAFMKKFAALYTKFVPIGVENEVNISNGRRDNMTAMMGKYWNADGNKPKPIQYAVPDDLRDAVDDIEVEVVSELADNALMQFLFTNEIANDARVPQPAPPSYWMDKNDSEDLAVSGYKPFLRFCKSRSLENNLNLYNKIRALDQLDDNYGRYMKKVDELWEKFLKPSARFSATIHENYSATWKDNCKALKRAHTKYWSNEKPRELWSLDPVIRIY